MEVEFYVSLSPEGLTERRRKKIVEWVQNLKKSLDGTVDRLNIRITSKQNSFEGRSTRCEKIKGKEKWPR